MSHGFGSLTATDGHLESERITVLHVDDDRAFADLAAEFLERVDERLEVVSERSASAGLDALDDDVDCIVSDYQMPERNGLEFFESVPPDYADVPFVLFTGKGSEEVASEALTAGVTDYLRKETGTDQYAVLANRIEQAVANARYRERVTLLLDRFRTLVEEANDVILVVSPAGEIRYATPSSEHILGRSPADLLGTSGFDPVHPADVEAVGAELEDLLENPGSRAHVEFRYERPDGPWTWLEIRGRNLLEEPTIDGIVVYAREIDDRKAREQLLRRREEKFRAIFEGAFDAMVIADDEGVYVDANPAACELFGLEKESLLGRRIGDFLPEGTEWVDEWADFRASDRDRGRATLVRPDGEERTVEFSAAMDVLPGQHLSVLRDVTDREPPSGR